MSSKKTRKHLTPRTLIQLIAVFILAFLVTSLTIWGYNRIAQYHRMYANLEEFASTEKVALTEDIFGSASDSAFSVAKNCITTAQGDTHYLKVCQRKVRHLLATPVHEEVLFSDASLYFVKREGLNLYILNWAGELTIDKIGSPFIQREIYVNEFDEEKVQSDKLKTRVPPANESLARYWNAFGSRCKYFNLYDYHACQVVTTIPLGADADGYLVTMMPLTEEEMWFWWPIYLPIVLLNLLLVAPTTIITGTFWMIFGQAVGILAFPVCMTWLYWRKGIRS